MFASNNGAVARYKHLGLVLAVRVYDGDDCGWRGHNDPDKAHMSYRSLEEAEAHPGAHPNCLLPGTIVLAPNAIAGYTRRYEGEAIDIRTASGVQLAVTPNHPILTGRGWLPAGELHETDYLIRCLDGEGIAAWLDPENQQMPTAIEDMATAAIVARGLSPVGVPCAGEYFHGDGIGSDVYHEWATCDMMSRRDTGNDQGGEDLRFMGAIEFAAALSALRPIDQLSLRGDTPARGGMGGIEHGGTLLGRVSCPTLSKGLTLCLDRDRVAVEDAPDTTVVTSHARGDSIARLAGLIAPDRLVSLDRRHVICHVYNLSAKQGWYVAGTSIDDNTVFGQFAGVITHNCQRAFGPVTDPAELPEGWNDRSA